MNANEIAEAPATYRGFAIHYSPINDALNAKPVDRIIIQNTELPPVAAHDWESLKATLDYALDEWLKGPTPAPTFDELRTAQRQLREKGAALLAEIERLQAQYDETLAEYDRVSAQL